MAESSGNVSHVLLSSSGALIGTLTVGPFEVGPVLAEDAWSTTRLAVHTASGEMFAIRSWTLHASDASVDHNESDGNPFESKEFRQHMVHVTRLQHPHIFPVSHLLLSSGAFHMATPFAAGGRLMSAVRYRWQQFVKQRPHAASGSSGVSATEWVKSTPQSQWIMEDRLGEDEARFYFQQLLSALRYAHSAAEGDGTRPAIPHGMLHPDSLWLEGPLPISAEFGSIDRLSYERRPHLRLVDFGIAAIRAHSHLADRLFAQSRLSGIVNGESIDSNITKLEEFVNFFAYAAPELLVPVREVGPEGSAPVVISDENLKSADVWSCGAILFTMISGASPFPLFGSSTGGSSHERVKEDIATVLSTEASLEVHLMELVKRICDGCLHFPSHFSRGIRGVRHLIGSMMTPDPTKRITLDQVMTHPWVDIRFEKSIRR